MIVLVRERSWRLAAGSRTRSAAAVIAPRMDPVPLFLLTVAAIFVIGAAGEIVFERTGVPDVLWLVTVGIVIGPVLGVVDAETLLRIAPYFGAFTLVVVLFHGGVQLRLGELARSAPRATALALLTFVSSAAGTGVLSMLVKWLGGFPPEWSWFHAAMLGAILGGSSSVVVMPAVERAGVDPRLGNLVSLESALTDVLCVVVAGAAITVILSGSADPAVILATLGRAFGAGLLAGLIAGMTWILAQPLFRGSEHEYPVTLGALLVLYVIIDNAGGSAAFGILIAAVLVGNAPAIASRIGLARSVELEASVQGFHARVTFIVKSFFFTFIGCMLRPPWGLLALGVVFGGVLLALRWPTAWLATARAGFSDDERRLVAVLLPRGMAAGVLAMMPHHAGVPGTQELPIVVFATVVTTIVLFATGFPFFRRRLARSAEPPTTTAP